MLHKTHLEPGRYLNPNVRLFSFSVLVLVIYSIVHFHINLLANIARKPLTTTLASSLDCSNLNSRRHKVEIVFAFGVIRQCSPQRWLWLSCAQLMANAMQLDLDSFTARQACKSQQSELSLSESLPNSTTTTKKFRSYP